LMIGWAVAVALLFVAFTDWSSNTKVLGRVLRIT
jgi:hypothetical protein